jgi:hypothetical protein
MSVRESTYSIAALARLGIAHDDISTLRRAQAALHRWAERECNGEVWIEDDGTAYSNTTFHKQKCVNMEARALRQVAKVLQKYPTLHAYHQGDPRGCALYVYKAADAKDKDIDAYYPTIGVAVL